MLEEMGIETGVDLPKLIAALAAAQEILGRPSSARADGRPRRLAPIGNLAICDPRDGRETRLASLA